MSWINSTGTTGAIREVAENMLLPAVTAMHRHIDDIRADDRRYGDDVVVVVCTQHRVYGGLTTMSVPLSQYRSIMSDPNLRGVDRLNEQLSDMVAFKRENPLEHYILAIALPNLVCWMRGRYSDFE